MRKIISVVLVMGVILVGLVAPTIANEWDLDRIVGGRTGYLTIDEPQQSLSVSGAAIGLAISISLVALAIAVWLLQQKKKEKKEKE